MTAIIGVGARVAPLKVELIREGSATPVHLNIGAEVVAMTRSEAHELAGALLTAAEFVPSREIRRPAEVNEAIAHGDL